MAKTDGMDLFGQIVTAQFADEQATSNALLEATRQEIAEWQTRFAQFYDSVVRATEASTTRKLEAVLTRYDSARAWVDEK